MIESDREARARGIAVSAFMPLRLALPVVAAVALAACSGSNDPSATAGTGSLTKTTGTIVSIPGGDSSSPEPQSGSAAAAATSSAPVTSLSSAPLPPTGSAPTSTVKPAATLSSIAVTPSILSLAPGATAKLIVTGTFSDGSVRTLASGETFQSSNPSVATVSASGVVTVPGTASNTATATLSAVDSTTRLSTAGAKSAQLTVSTGDGAPTATSAAAVSVTATRNAMCTAIQPFYYELGNATAALVNGSSTASGGTPVTSSTSLSIASASKWIYGTYVVQKRGGAANLTTNDVSFLTFSSGYTYMGTDTQGATCTAPSGGGTNSIGHCLTLPSKTTPGMYFDSQNGATAGVFDYDAGHEENHAGKFQPEISTLDTSDIGPTVAAGLNLPALALRYTQPLLAGGLYTTADAYASILRAIVGGQLGMLDALGTHAVCAWPGNGCNAPSSPIYQQHWHYSISHWVEDDPTSGDGAFSSPGAFGFYPWIEANKKYYGVISRAAPSVAGVQNGVNSALCGHALRAAWESGVQQ